MNHEGFKIVVFLYIITLLITPTYADSQTHNDSIHYWQFDNNSTLRFSDTIHLGNSYGLWYWINDDGIRFYNLRVDSSQVAPDPWEVHISSNTNISIGRLFLDGELDLSISVPEETNSSLRFSCGSRGVPHSVTGLDIWEFNSSTSYLNLTAEENSSVLISWMGPYYYWPEPDQPTIPIMIAVEVPPVFHPSFMEYLTDRISIALTVRIVNEDTVDHTLDLAYQILSETGEVIQEEDLTLDLQALSEKTLIISTEIPFHKREEPKQYTATLNLTRDEKLIMDPISHTLRVEHNRNLSLLYTLLFLGIVVGLLSLSYGLYKYWPEKGK